MINHSGGRSDVLRVGRADRVIDAAIDRLVASYKAEGLPAIQRSGKVDRMIAKINAEIAPLTLPRELERFWKLVDPTSVTVAPYPQLMTLDFALNSWTMLRDEFPGQSPRLLFPVCYESHGYLFVELEDGRGSGGICLESSPGADFTVRFPTFAAYIDLIATMVELGEYMRHERETHTWVEFDPERRWNDAQSVRLSAAQPLPGFGHDREIDENPHRWPEHWRLADGLTPAVRSARGATTSIANLQRQADAGSDALGTIRAHVTSLAISGEGSRVSVNDGSGVLDMWCPAAVCTYGPRIRSEFEFDVVVHANPAPPVSWGAERAEVQRLALNHDLAGAQAAAAEFYAKAFQTPVAAHATAIRPVD